MTLKRRTIGMIRATHFGPTVLVVTITFVLAVTQVSTVKALEIALAILAGQCVVGWTNELLDHARDVEAGRSNKPLVNQSVSRLQLQIGVGVALTAAIALSFLGPLGARGGWIHMLGLASATAYNFGVKSTWFSPLPYAISFGALPWAIYSAVHRNPPAWLVIVLILVTVAFHFLNVIKDLEWDLAQQVLGAPQRLGKRGSVLVTGILIIAALVVLLFR